MDSLLPVGLNIDENGGSVAIYFGESWLLKQDDEQKFNIYILKPVMVI